MAVLNKLVPLLHTPIAEPMAIAQTASAANMFCIADQTGRSPWVMYVTSTTVVYLYKHDSWMQIASPALATFGAGACGVYYPWSQTFTASGGSTSTVTVAIGTANIQGFVVGETIEFLSATNVGIRTTITSVTNTGSGTITIGFATLGAANTSSTTFRISSGRFYVFGGGTLASGTFKFFDVATMAWSAALSITGLTATFAGDAKMATPYQLPKVYQSGNVTQTTNTTNATITDSTKTWNINQYAGYWVRIIGGTGSPSTTTGDQNPLLQITSNTATTLTLNGTFTVAPNTTSQYTIEDVIASGVATSGSTTTLLNSGKAWTASQWVNYQVRVTGATGLGDKGIVSASTSTQLTIPTQGTAIASGSIYTIEPSEDALYLLGNSATAIFKYSISGNTWSTLTARSTVTGASPSANCPVNCQDPTWTVENSILNGQYIYSYRGGGSAVLDQYSIPAGTWVNGVTSVQTVTFTTGANYTLIGRYLVIEKESASTVRYFFIYDIAKNFLFPWFTLTFPDGAAITGNRIWAKTFDQNQPYNQLLGAAPYAWSDSVIWIYALQATGTYLHRIPLYI
jgi:hypothetical protein